MDTKKIYNVDVEELSKYELVLLIARRAKEINEMRIGLEKKYETRLIEKIKPTVVAMDEFLDHELAYERRKPGQKPTFEQPQRGMKKTI